MKPDVQSSKRRFGVPFVVLAAIGSMACFPGCAAHAPGGLTSTRPAPDRFGERRSLVTDAAALYGATSPVAADPPWYASRHDDRPRTTLPASSGRQVVVTTTRDTQRVIDGRVFDSYRRTTRSRTVDPSPR